MDSWLPPEVLRRLSAIFSELPEAVRLLGTDGEVQAVLDQARAERIRRQEERKLTGSRPVRDSGSRRDPNDHE